MVLAQLGCNEYLPQFRDQEVLIDMQAFLLLDEQNLKDIGVSTMGARKKIYNAILKLKESAKRHGYSV
ncbi:CBN-BCC-1 protein [Aphelenchoides avenae]|nr:CBN-BCC-1 protein [Aphelenchus avenae]